MTADEPDGTTYRTRQLVVGLVLALGRRLNRVAYFPAPALCQGADEDLIIKIGAIISPGFVQRNPPANGLRLKLEGDYRDDSLVKTATDHFQTRIPHPISCDQTHFFCWYVDLNEAIPIGGFQSPSCIQQPKASVGERYA